MSEPTNTPEELNRPVVLEKRFPIVGENKKRGSSLGIYLGIGAVVMLIFGVGWSFFRPVSTSPMPQALGTKTLVGTPMPTLLYVPMPYTVTVQSTVIVTHTKVVSSVRIVTATPSPTLFPIPTFTPYPLGVVRDGSCWIFDIYGVDRVTVDRTPVAPAFGKNRVCGSEVVIR